MGRANNLDLSALEIRKLPLRYGTENCYIALTDDRYTEQIVELRNTPSLGRYINYVELSIEDHRRWLAGQLDRDDALNFVLIARGKFSGMLSLYNIEHGSQCELGRVMVPKARRFYAMAIDVLGASFAFEVLGMRTLYCVVMEGNRLVLDSMLLKYGWKMDPRFARCETVRGTRAHLIGLSIDRPDWLAWYGKMLPLIKRVLVDDSLRVEKRIDKIPSMSIQVSAEFESLAEQGTLSGVLCGCTVHPLSDVKTREIGNDTRIWQYAVVLPGARIGAGCNICAHVFIENDVIIGDRVTVKSGVQLWDGLRVGNDVFIGPNATFTNDRFPRSRSPHKLLQTTIEQDASIGAGAIILPGLIIGAGAMVAAGAVVTKNVAPRSLVRGNPARHVRFLEE